MRSAAGRLTLETLVPRDVLGALRALGIDAEERGDEAVALCPHPDHDDRSPSWSCNLEDGRHHCFACGFGGSFVYLVTKMLGKPTPDSQQWVRERKIKDVSEGHVGPRQKAPRNTEGLSEADLWKFTEPPAEALADRGLTAEACRECDVRWDDERKLWITPVRDPYTGRLWGWQEKNAKYFRNRPLDIPKSHTLFGFQSLGQGGTAVHLMCLTYGLLESTVQSVVTAYQSAASSSFFSVKEQRKLSSLLTTIGLDGRASAQSLTHSVLWTSGYSTTEDCLLAAPRSPSSRIPWTAPTRAT
jgi:hypothetical protein